MLVIGKMIWIDLSGQINSNRFH